MLVSPLFIRNGVNRDGKIRGLGRLLKSFCDLFRKQLEAGFAYRYNNKLRGAVGGADDMQFYAIVGEFVKSRSSKAGNLAKYVQLRVFLRIDDFTQIFMHRNRNLICQD